MTGVYKKRTLALQRVGRVVDEPHTPSEHLRIMLRDGRGGRRSRDARDLSGRGGTGGGRAGERDEPPPSHPLGGAGRNVRLQQLPEPDGGEDRDPRHRPHEKGHHGGTLQKNQKDPANA